MRVEQSPAWYASTKQVCCTPLHLGGGTLIGIESFEPVYKTHHWTGQTLP